MKYGMRERVSGAVILVALGVIFIPMLFDDPPSREEQPEPVLTIEQPIDVVRTPIEEPQMPASLGQIQMPASPQSDAQPNEATEPTTREAVPEPSSVEPEQAQQMAEPEPQPDPIADLARQSEQRQRGAQQETQPQAPPSNGEWAVQVGSFGEPGNAERLKNNLAEQGFTVFSQSRSNNLTTVYVGPFTTSESGKKARTELKEHANIQGLLVRLKEEE